MRLSNGQKSKIKQYFEGRREVAAVYLYGSQVAGRAHQDSDVDVGVLLNEEKGNREELKLQLEYIAAVGEICQQDLSADVKILREDKPVAYLRSVVAEGELLVERDRSRRVEFEVEVNQRYLDFYPVLESYYQQMNERIKEGRYAQ